MDKSQIIEELNKLAYQRSTPFCYGCYIEALKRKCPQCHSDDLCRLVEGVGVDWGTSWIVEHILEEELTPFNVEESFEESIRSCYPETTQVGWMSFDTVSLMKEMDPISWRCALSEYESEEESEENIISFDGGSTYYARHELEDFLATATQ